MDEILAKLQQGLDNLQAIELDEIFINDNKEEI